MSDFDRLDEFIEQEINEGTFPGAVVLVMEEGERIVHEKYGLRAEVPSNEEMSKDTIFDLASLTKVVFTTTMALRLVESGEWKLADPVSRYLEEFPSDIHVKIKHLLTHTSGIVPWMDLFSGSDDRSEALERLFSDKWPILDPVIPPPADRVVYSDLNFIILGLAIERTTGKTLDKLAEEKIFRPLDMSDSYFNPPEGEKGRIAPTEYSESRGGVIRGEVHDENSYALGGVSGHAGLFSTAGDLSNFVYALLNGGKYENYGLISPRTMELLKKNFTKGLDSRRTLGWKLQGEGATSAGDLLSSESFGHTGFTGGSIWLDPVRELGVVVLTNRVHPDRVRGEGRIQDFRARLHNLIAGELL